MNFLLQIVLVVIAAVCAGGALIASRRIILRPPARLAARSARVRIALASFIAVIAWVPVWVFTHLLWHPFAGHDAPSYSTWFAYLFLFGIVLTGVNMFVRRLELFWPTWAIGIILVAVAAWYINWFAPKGGIHMSDANWWFAALAVVVLIGIVLLGKFFSWWLFTVVALVAVICTIAGLMSVHTDPIGGSVAGNLTTQQQEQQAAQAGLIVDYNKVSTDMCKTLVKKHFGANYLASVTVGKTKSQTPGFDIGAMHPAVGSANPKHLVPRLWSTAVNVPLQKPRTLETEQAVVCRDPAQAAMVMNGIGKVKIGGKSVASLNSWMSAQGSPAAIKSWAQHCWTTSVETHLACAKTMAAAATLLGRFHSGGVHRASSTWNYELAHGGLVVGKVPAFALSPAQEKNAYFLVISVTSKTQGCLLKFGFNVGKTKLNGGDQRLAGMSCMPKKQPKTPSKHTTPHPKTSTSTRSHSTPSTPTHPHPSTPHPSSHSSSCRCVSTTQVQIPVRESGYPTVVNSSATSRPHPAPSPTVAPTTGNPSGYNGGSQPPGGSHGSHTGNPTPTSKPTCDNNCTPHGGGLPSDPG